jgi:hypothetical protein
MNEGIPITTTKKYIMFVKKVPLPPSFILDIILDILGIYIRHLQKIMQCKK